jgi:hypothetical protein
LRLGQFDSRTTLGAAKLAQAPTLACRDSCRSDKSLARQGRARGDGHSHVRIKDTFYLLGGVQRCSQSLKPSGKHWGRLPVSSLERADFTACGLFNLHEMLCGSAYERSYSRSRGYRRLPEAGPTNHGSQARVMLL